MNKLNLKKGSIGLEILGVIAAFALVVVIVNSLSINQERKACDVFQQESGRQTKFTRYTYWWADCLTPSTNIDKDGNVLWISATNLRDN